MNISIDAIVSNSDIIKNYKSCRDKATELGKIFILKYNQPDAVLFSIEEYERFFRFIEYLDKQNPKAIAKIYESLPKAEIKGLDS